MVTVTINKDAAGNIIGFSAAGHAQYAPEGEDIICSAVSAILQTAVFGLTKHLDLKPEVTTQDGWLTCRLDSKLARDKEVKAILETMLIGLQETEKAYSEHLTVKERRANNA